MPWFPDNYVPLKVGDIVKCLHTVNFIDGSYHKKDNSYTVTSQSLAYYNNACNRLQYQRVYTRDTK